MRKRKGGEGKDKRGGGEKEGDSTSRWRSVIQRGGQGD